MVSSDGRPIDPRGQGVLFSLYSDDQAEPHEQLLAASIDAGESSTGRPDRSTSFVVLTLPDTR
jgi:hypothetical protein